MEITSIHSFLVHPGKVAEAEREINGSAVAQSGPLFGMLRPVFDNAEFECQHSIAFVPKDDGKQENECRDAIISYIQKPDLKRGRDLAKRLQKVTTHRSGLGLLFITMAKHKGDIKILVSRFPADSGILAEENPRGLTVEFLERIFMKSATSYKAALYVGKSFDSDFWRGKAADKQINSAQSYIADYWIRDFLLSDFLTPGEAGTRRLAIALRKAMNESEEPEVKKDLVALQRLIANMPNKVTSSKTVLEQFHVGEKTHEEIRKRFPRGKSFEENFRFVPDEFVKHLAVLTVELDNGALLSAQTDRFDQVFDTEPVAGSNEIVRYSTEGRIVDRRLRKTIP